MVTAIALSSVLRLYSAKGALPIVFLGEDVVRELLNRSLATRVGKSVMLSSAGVDAARKALAAVDGGAA